MLTEVDLTLCAQQNKCVEAIKKQLAIFEQGIPPVKLVTPAVVGNGIQQIDAEQAQELIHVYNAAINSLDVVKFVPASGAATRMFSHLVRFVEEYNPEEELLRNYLKKPENIIIKEFFDHFSDFPFANLVRKLIRAQYPDYKKLKKGPRSLIIANTILQKKGLDYLNIPKGLVPFHKYIKYNTTAFEEQLYEAVFYAETQGEVAVHFTFSEKHVPFFKQAYETVKKRVEKKTKINFRITYSFQKKETDTIAVTLNNQPLRDNKGHLVFRPAGHGALIENLNDIEADIVFIKNIDNVVCEAFVEEVAQYKKMLAGKLLEIQKKCFSYLKYLSNALDNKKVSEIKTFVWNELNNKSNPTTISEIKRVLNRPLRVCGVVLNTGAPGGGPFWVQHQGQDSLQIVEKAQINVEDPIQKSILDNATHFNPVDIVCGIKDFEGNRFNLLDFVTSEGGFITQKTFNGQPIKALELPGLWNGSMADWNTIFVEVPLTTFNPVKTVNDLLQIEHRPLA